MKRSTERKGLRPARGRQLSENEPGSKRCHGCPAATAQAAHPGFHSNKSPPEVYDVITGDRGCMCARVKAMII